ncbi:DHHW family protein [Bhargavaea ginsengi]|uniref:DHHW family protein n=1 Tax=Bhargavaea ginsengi TaxID=426757 RepID=UPI00203DD263|nr:DHHW family protein [Bhargavaea ginsengi]MCM3089348.1 DHHW family protein [Bhargavaea ginsengi]
MNKLNLLLPIGLFLMLGGGLAAHLLLPDRSASQMENRTLAAAPTSPSSAEVLSGDWSKQAESYFTDQFPLRDIWMKSFVRSELAVGKTYINEKYFADFDSGWITSGPSELHDEETLDAGAVKAQNINEHLKELGIPFTFYSLPAKATYVREPHPDYMPEDAGIENNARFLEKLADRNIRSVRLIDTMRTIEPKLDPQKLYFKTDHHWKIDGAMLGYQAIIHDLIENGIPVSGAPLSEENMKRSCLENPFEGSWNKFYHMLVPNDDLICYLEPDGMADRFSISATSVTGTSDASYEDIYGVARKLPPEQSVNYSVGYTSDYPELDIHNADANSGHLVVLKDSYFNPITFLTAYHFQRTTVIDLRYYEGDLDTWIEAEQPDAVIMAYNDRNFDLGF